MAVQTVEELLRSRIGLDPASVGIDLVARATKVRMAAREIPTNEAPRYLELLERSNEEFEALVEEVVIPESWFFRDERPFQVLADHLGRIASDPTRAPARVLSVPCAQGEEPYSAAIAALERGLAPERFQVLGVDLSRKALAAARRGIYSANAFRSRNLSFRDRFFRRVGQGWKLSPVIMDRVEFRHENIVAPGFLANEAPFDAIFCRNLLIYLDEPARGVALAHLDRLLGPDGLLFVGHSENLGALAARFRPIGATYSFAFVRRTPDHAATAVASNGARPLAPPRTPTISQRPRRTASALGFNEQRADARNLPPRAETTGPDPTLEEAARLADLGRNREAAAICESLIRAEGPSAAALFLMGVIAQAENRHDQAESCFEKAVYLDPRHDEALLALSLLARRRGDEAAASNYLRRSGRTAGEGTSR